MNNLRTIDSLNRRVAHLEANREVVVGSMLTEYEKQKYFGAVDGGWITGACGQRIYGCNGAHLDGTFGFQIKEIR